MLLIRRRRDGLMMIIDRRRIRTVTHRSRDHEPLTTRAKHQYLQYSQADHRKNPSLLQKNLYTHHHYKVSHQLFLKKFLYQATHLSSPHRPPRLPVPKSPAKKPSTRPQHSRKKNVSPLNQAHTSRTAIQYARSSSQRTCARNSSTSQRTTPVVGLKCAACCAGHRSTMRCSCDVS